MLENFLADELALTIAIGGDPDALGASQRLTNGFQLARLVASFGWTRGVKIVGLKKVRRPALPGWIDILRLDQVEQMALGGKNIAVARANCRADVCRLTVFLGDDDLISYGKAVCSFATFYSKKNIIRTLCESKLPLGYYQSNANQSPKCQETSFSCR